MEQQIIKLYSQAILQEAMLRFSIAEDQIKPLNAFESFIYEFERDQNAYILRISHSIRRSENLINGEVDWINYLDAGGVSVARAIQSDNGKLVEAVEDGRGEHFLATAFVKALGLSPWELWNPEIYQTYGKLLGSMHALAGSYQPLKPEWKRPEWDDDIMEFVQHYLPATEGVVRQKYRALSDYLYTLPKAKSTYGLIHQDAHGSNLFVDEAGNLTLFDFDDCAYSWFINDIAIVLFYIVMDADDWPAFTAEFMTHFLRGYRQTHRLDPVWLKEIPVFLKMREMELYAVIHRDFDVNEIDHPWIARFMRERKFKLEHDVPFIDFDFESLSVYL